MVGLLSKELDIDKKQIKADLLVYCEQVADNIWKMFLARINPTKKDDFGKLSDKLWAKEEVIKKFAKLVTERENIIKDMFLKEKETIQHAAGLFAED